MGILSLKGSVYRATEWISRFAYVNGLWVLLTVAGLGVFGWAPATVAMFVVMRKWLMGEKDVSVFKMFWQAYKKHFIQANIFGLFYFGVGYILFFDLVYFKSQEGLIFQIMFYLFLMIFYVLIISLFFVFPVFVHYDLKKRLQVIKYSMVIPLMRPLEVIGFLAVGAILGFLLILFPSVGILFGISLFGYLDMYSAYRAFSKIEQKGNSLLQKK
ncbi:YesL family protein [Paraliobacillus salinarum]|uniref:YesL family protein n=1 Tax=Paraliobacillus salinarum TaxID=1158996 RepID=UPI0015F6759D|nr:YesL family protein [Paraliobacillus salinarum]